MLFHFTSLLFASLFFFYLSWIGDRPTAPSWSWYLTTMIPLFLISFVAAKRITGRLLAAYLPCVVAFSVGLLLLLIDLPFEEHVFVVVGSILYYLSLLSLYRIHTMPEDQTARAMQNIAGLASLFFIYAGSYGLYLNYQVPLWLLMFVFFLATLIVSFQTLRGVTKKSRRLIFMASLILGIVFGELVWLLHFWPFGYLTTAIVTLVLFYWLWKVALDDLKDTFSQKTFLFESTALFLLILLLLSTTPWRMLV